MYVTDDMRLVAEVAARDGYPVGAARKGGPFAAEDGAAGAAAALRDEDEEGRGT